jgi:anti-sigma factor RsiW
MPPSADQLRCEVVLDRLEPYLDGELDDTTGRRIRGHLERCPACAEEAAAARRVLSELRSLPELDLPPSIIERVRAGINAKTRDTPSSGGVDRWMRWLKAAAAVLIAVGAVSFFRPQAEPPSDEALRAAADVKIALSTLSGITRRARDAAVNEVIDQRVAPAAVRGLISPLRHLSHIQPSGTPMTPPPAVRIEGRS